MKNHLAEELIRHLFVIMMLLTTNCPAVFSQKNSRTYDVYATWDDFVGEYTEWFNDDREDGNFSTEDFAEDMERLERLHLYPLNINEVEKEDLMLLPFISEAQADSILSYRIRAHEFYSLGELQFVSTIKPTLRKWLSLFFYAQRVEKSNMKWMKGKSKHTIIASLDIPFYQRAGNKPHTQEEINKNPNSVYLGNGMANTVRYHYNIGKDFDANISLQKDAGEPWGRYQNYPYDYVSAYVHLVSKNRLWNFWAGDFDIRTSHGLLFSSGLFKNKAQLNEYTSPKPLQVKGHSSCDEINYFRGIATKWQKDYWSCMFFGSIRQLDGILNNDSVTSFSNTGLHRTITEINRRRNIDNFTSGMYIGYRGTKVMFGLSAVYDYYNHVIWPMLRDYNRYYMRGKSAFGLGGNYDVRQKKWNHSGEFAFDDKLHWAWMHETRFAPSSDFSITGQLRYFGTKFVSIHGATMQENSRIQNEMGAILSLAYLPSNHIEVSAYAEYFRFPRPTFRASIDNSQGYAMNVQMKYIRNNALSYKIRYRFKTKQVDVSGHKGILQYASSHRLTLSSTYAFSAPMTLNVAVDAVVSSSQTSTAKSGFMLSSRLSWRNSERLTWDAFAATFFTDDFNNRLYAYEPQLRYAASFPSFAYHGMRFVGQCNWKLLDFIQISGRCGLLHYFNKNKIASGTQQIDNSTKCDFTLQTIISF